jgi:hypothetical protein
LTEGKIRIVAGKYSGNQLIVVQIGEELKAWEQKMVDQINSLYQTVMPMLGFQPEELPINGCNCR